MVCSVAPAAAYSSASGEGPGSATWQSNSSGGRLRTIRTSRWSAPPRSATGWTESSRIMRVALNLEQLLQTPPGGVGRYTAELARLLPGLDGGDRDDAVELVPFVARHRTTDVREALNAWRLGG